MKVLIKNIFDKFGYELRKKKKEIAKLSTRKAEGFPEWLRKADEAGMDVNDYICSKMGSPVPTLEMFVFPYLKGIKDPVFCEIGTIDKTPSEFIKLIAKHRFWKRIINK